MGFTREECEYTNFNIGNAPITFSCDNEKNVLISIPFADDTPQCVKDKLNEILWQEMNKALEENIIEGCFPRPHTLLLEARMQINYDYELGVQYYITIDVSDFDFCHLITKDVSISASSPSELHKEMVSYCRYKLDKILFPVW